jgi:hypothetical protein
VNSSVVQSLKRVTDSPITGVKIYTTETGSTRGWTTKDAGFSYNANNLLYFIEDVGIFNTVGSAVLGTYESLAIDYTRIGSSTIRIVYDYDASDPNATDLSYPDRTDQTYPNDTDTHVTVIMETHVYFKYSDDNITYTAYEEYFGVTEKSFRYLKVKFTVDIETVTGEFVLNNLIITMDVPDVAFDVKGLSIAGTTGTTVTFSDYGYAFYLEPTVQATVIGGTINKVPVITSKSATSCVIKLYDVSNNVVAGVVDLRITGY